ncbi:MAG: thioredoxin family protein [Candidatus Obscuribacterales bacterium]|nr:thioredoxin family protein [Candidatus Obscuribacterales bacterium]
MAVSFGTFGRSASNPALLKKLALGMLSVSLLASLAMPQAIAAPTAKAASKSGAKSKLPQVLDFSAEWCVPCKKFAPIFDKVSENYKDKVEFIHYDVEKGPGKKISEDFKVNSMPTVLFLDSKGKVAERVEKLMTEEELVKKTDALLK